MLGIIPVHFVFLGRPLTSNFEPMSSIKFKLLTFNMPEFFLGDQTIVVFYSVNILFWHSIAVCSTGEILSSSITLNIHLIILASFFSNFILYSFKTLMTFNVYHRFCKLLICFTLRDCLARNSI